MRRAIQDEKAGWKIAAAPPPLSAATADQLLASWRGPRRVSAVRPLAGGLMNRNYQIRLTGSANAFVLRFFDRDPAACAKEAALLAVVRDDVPVPDVCHVEAAGVDGLPPFLVLQFIDGISMRELKRRGDDRSIGEAAYDAGRVLARLSSHRFDRSGLLTPTLAVDSGEFEGLTWSGLVEHFAQSPTFQRRVDRDLRDRVITWARSTEEYHIEPEAPSLVHGDFNSANVLVRELNGRWLVSSVLDWEFAFAGSVLSDIGNMLRYERSDRPRFEPHFSRGCVDGGLRLSDDWRQRARLADLPALCELLARAAAPEAVVAEVRDLIVATVDSGGI